MKKWILSLVALSSAQVFAADSTEATFKVKQVIKSHKLVVVQTNATEQFPNGKIFLATFNDGSQCSLVLKNSGKQLLTLDSTPCDQPAKLTIKTQIEPSLISVEEKPNASAEQGIAGYGTKAPAENKPEESNPDNFYDKSTVGRLGVSLYYTAADQLKFNNGKIESSSTDFSATFGLEKAIGLGVHYMRAKPYAWGYSAGALLESRRDFKTFSVSGNGTTNAGDITSDTRITFLIGEMSILYRYEDLYIPFGLNFSLPIFEYHSTSSKVEAQGNFGLQFGLGYFVNDNLAIEGYYRVLGMTLKQEDLITGDNKVDYSYGYLSGVALGVKYLF